MYDEFSIKNALDSDVAVASVVAHHLGLYSNFFTVNKDSSVLKKTFKIFKVQGVVHLKLPMYLKKYIVEYNATLLKSDDDENEFDFVVKLNNHKKIGFWK